MNLKLFRAGGERYKLRFYVAHDGSMVRLAALLGFGKNGPLRWPAMGSEIVMEVCVSGNPARCPLTGLQVWETFQKEKFVRVLHEGTTVLGYEWIPLDAFISAIEAQIPENIFEQCNST